MLQEQKYNIMNKLKQLYKWIANDGLLYILVSIVLMLSFQPIIGYLLSLIITIIFGLIKEIYDYFIQKDNNLNQIKHDIICDILGILIGTIILIINYIVNLIW